MKNIFILDKEIIMDFLNYLKKEENLFEKINYKQNVFRNFLFNRKKSVNKEDDSNLKKEDLRFRKIIELAPDGIMLIDLTRKVTLVNDEVRLYILYATKSDASDSFHDNVKVFSALTLSVTARPSIESGGVESEPDDVVKV